MAFINPINPGFGRTNVKPAISPQVMPQMEVPKPPSSAVIRNSNANINESTNSRNSGGRIGGRKKSSRRGNGRNNTPIIPIAKFEFNSSNNPSRLDINQGDFGYDVTGSNTPNKFVGSVDQTLFRDYNIESTIGSGTELAPNYVTNVIKSLNIGPKESLNSSESYKSAYNVIHNMILREVVSKTRAAKGALDAVNYDTLLNYLDTVTQAYDFLIGLETLQAWDPDNTSEFDRTFRKIASLTTTTDILEARTKLRQALIPHILPLGWMQYIKWLRQTHTSGPAKESTKLRFMKSIHIELVNAVVQGNEISQWITSATNLASQVESLDAKIPAIIANNVETIPFGNVKDHYTNVYKSATYDAEFCNIFNNRVVAWRFGTTSDKYPKISSTSTAFAAFNSDRPYSLALANLAYQFSDNVSHLPLESGLTVIKVDDQAVYHSNFYIKEDSNTFKVRGIERWFESKDDSTHVIDMDTAAKVDSRISMARNNDTALFVAGLANINMAQRESLDNITLNRK